MDKQRIIDYVMQSPQNSNPAVLGSLLDQYGSEEPTGTLDITENGTYDVSDYAEVDVDVPSTTPIQNVIQVQLRTPLDQSSSVGASFIITYSKVDDKGQIVKQSDPGSVLPGETSQRTISILNNSFIIISGATITSISNLNPSGTVLIYGVTDPTMGTLNGAYIESQVATVDLSITVK